MIVILGAKLSGSRCTSREGRIACTFHALRKNNLDSWEDFAHFFLFKTALTVYRVIQYKKISLLVLDKQKVLSVQVSVMKTLRLSSYTNLISASDSPLLAWELMAPLLLWYYGIA